MWKLKRAFTGSQVTPLTSPVWPLSIFTIAGTLFISQTMTVLSTLQLASQRSRGDHAKSNMSPMQSIQLRKMLNCAFGAHAKSMPPLNWHLQNIPEWPRSVADDRQFSAAFVTPPEPNTDDGPLLRVHNIMILSSPPDANMLPLHDHRTEFTHAKWLSSWHRTFGTDLSRSAASLMIGSKFQITTRPESLPRPPVAKRLPSGWMSIEKIPFSAATKLKRTNKFYLFIRISQINDCIFHVAGGYGGTIEFNTNRI